MRGVVKGLKSQLADAQAAKDEKKASCDADLRSLASGLTQAGADAGKFAGLSFLDTNTLN